MIWWIIGILVVIALLLLGILVSAHDGSDDLELQAQALEEWRKQHEGNR